MQSIKCSVQSCQAAASRISAPAPAQSVVRFLHLITGVATLSAGHLRTTNNRNSDFATTSALSMDDVSKYSCTMEFSFLNDTHAQPSACEIFQTPSAQFPRFSELPTELRLRIWELAVPRLRLLKLDIVTDSEPTSTQRPVALYQTHNTLGKLVSGADYVLRLRSTGYLSPLSRVNREANRAVSDFYRVHMPLSGRDVSGSTVPCLSFCPETDTIHLHVEGDGHDAHFADVVHDAAAYDPKGKGILHMAIGGYVMPSDIRLPLDPVSLPIRARNALISTLSNLHSVTLIDIVRASARFMFPSLQEHDLRFNRSMPLWSTAACFYASQTDPRPIEQDLDLVCLGWDPRAMIRAWQTLITAFGVSPTPAERMRVLVAAPSIASPGPREIVNRGDACRFRAQEEAAWARNFEIYNRYGYVNTDTEETMSRARQFNAVGFWVFPLEAFGDVPMERYDTYRWRMQHKVDLRPFRPLIALFDLAEG